MIRHLTLRHFNHVYEPAESSIANELLRRHHWPTFTNFVNVFTNNYCYCFPDLTLADIHKPGFADSGITDQVRGSRIRFGDWGSRIGDHGSDSGITDRGSRIWFGDHGSRIGDHGSGIMDRGSRIGDPLIPVYEYQLLSRFQNSTLASHPNLAHCLESSLQSIILLSLHTQI